METPPLTPSELVTLSTIDKLTTAQINAIADPLERCKARLRAMFPEMNLPTNKK